MQSVFSAILAFPNNIKQLEGAMRKLFRTALLVATLGPVVGCHSMPVALQDNAALILSPKCLAIFTDTGLLRYAHGAWAAQLWSGQGPVFALAKDAAGQACGWALPSDTVGAIGYTSFSRIEALAIARCEAVKPNAIKAPCKIFANGNKIVWDEKKNVEMQ